MENTGFAVTNLLHMETDNVQACALKLRAQSETIRRQAQALAVSARSVDWYGPSRDIFQHEVEQLARSMTLLADEGQILAARALREADQWQNLDEHFSQQFSQIIVLPPLQGE